MTTWQVTTRDGAAVVRGEEYVIVGAEEPAPVPLGQTGLGSSPGVRWHELDRSSDDEY